MEGDNGLVIKNAGAHHAISAKFPKAIDSKDKTLVVQYEVKLQSKHTFPTIHSMLMMTDNQRRWPRMWWCLYEATTR